MPRLVTYQCDVCGATKKESNHWWIVNIAPDLVFSVSPFSETLVNGSNVICCGMKCLLKRLDNWVKLLAITKEE